MAKDFLDLRDSLPQFGERVLLYSLVTGEMEMGIRTVTGFNKANGYPFRSPTHYMRVVAPGETK